MNAAQSRALAADYNWKAHQGTALKLLLNKHPYADAMIADIETFKTMTGMSVTWDIFPEDVYFDKVTAALSSRSTEYQWALPWGFEVYNATYNKPVFYSGSSPPKNMQELMTMAHAITQSGGNGNAWCQVARQPVLGDDPSRPLLATPILARGISRSPTENRNPPSIPGVQGLHRSVRRDGAG